MGVSGCLFACFNFKKTAVNSTKNSVLRRPSSSTSLFSSDNAISEIVLLSELGGRKLSEVTIHGDTNTHGSMFPILRLPLLALQHCLKVLEPSALVDFSLCSKATRRIVKFIKIKPDTFLVEFDERSGITLIFKEFPGIKWIFTFNSNTGFEETDVLEKRIANGEDYFAMRSTKLTGPQVEIILDTNWSQRVIGLEKLVEHFVYIFNCPITHCTFIHDHFSCICCAEVPDLFFRTLSILDNIHFVATSRNNHEVKRMLDNMSISKYQYLRLEIETKKGFRYRKKEIFNAEKLNVIKGEWITIENILDMKKCNRIHIWKSTIFDNDLNVFIKSWIDGNYPRLGAILISRDEKNEESGNKDVILNGTNFEKLDLDTLRFLEKNEKLKIPFALITPGGYSFCNKNGSMASCLMGNVGNAHTFIFLCLDKLSF